MLSYNEKAIMYKEKVCSNDQLKEGEYSSEEDFI